MSEINDLEQQNNLKELEQISSYYNFGFDPCELQVEVISKLLDTEYKEVVLVAGRGWGKDLLLGMYLYHLCYTRPNTRVIFITPFYKQIKNFISQVMNGVNKETGEHFIPHGLKEDPTFKVFDGKEIWFKNPSNGKIDRQGGSVIIGVSADNPENIRSFRSDVIVMNEVEDIPENVINTEIYAVIKKDAPKIVFVGTPKGKRHLFKKFVQGLHKPNSTTRKWYDPTKLSKSCISFHATYLDNEKTSCDVETMKNQLSVVQFNQEVMAEFIDDSLIFSNLHEAFMVVELGDEIEINKWFIDPVLDIKKDNQIIPGHRYVAGWDIAKNKDWSVLTLIDIQTGKMVYFERFQKTDYVTQCKKVLEVCKKYNSANLVYDATGVGTAVADILFELNTDEDQAIQGFVFTNDTKADMINKLVIRVERDKEWIAQIPVLQTELQSLKESRTKLGKPTYSAPEGSHDDCVMSLGLANLLFMTEKLNQN